MTNGARTWAGDESTDDLARRRPSAAPTSLGPHAAGILALQRTAGNRAAVAYVQRTLTLQREHHTRRDRRDYVSWLLARHRGKPLQQVLDALYRALAADKGESVESGWSRQKLLKDKLIPETDLEALEAEVKRKVVGGPEPKQAGTQAAAAPSAKVTWAYGAAMKADLEKAHKGGYGDQLAAIQHAIEDPKNTTVGDFVDNAGLQKFHFVPTVGLYECYLDTKALGSGSVLRCFFRVKRVTGAQGHEVHYEIVAIGEHATKEAGVKKPLYGEL